MLWSQFRAAIIYLHAEDDDKLVDTEFYHTESLNLVDVANDFIPGNNHRKQVFGIELNPLIQYEYAEFSLIFPHIYVIIKKC